MVKNAAAARDLLEPPLAERHSAGRVRYEEMAQNFRQVVRDFLTALKQIGEGYMHAPPGC